MKTTITIMIAVLVALLFTNKVALAQYNMNQYYMTQQRINQASNQMNAQMQQRMNQLQREQQQRIAKMQKRVMQMINQYRKKTGDTTSSDQQIYNILLQKERRDNPQACADIERRSRQRINQANALHQQNMANNRQAFNRQQEIYKQNSQASDARYKAYRANSAASDSTQRRIVDSIHEQSNYTNPNTGVVVKLPNHSPNTYYNNNSGGTYRQAPNGQYYYYQNGYRTQMNNYNR